MWERIRELSHHAMQAICRFDRQDWIVIFAIVVVIGFFCMRGFGSRTDY